MDAKTLYAKAYSLHYKFDNPYEAYWIYEKVIRQFPNAKEAKYAITQKENIESMNDFSRERLQEYRIVADRSIEEENIARIQKSIKNADDKIQITSGYNFEGYDIVSYISHESAQIVLGTGIFSSFDVSLSDFFGTNSNSYENKLEEAEKAAKKRLIEKAKRCGGNAIIGLDVDYTTFANDVMGVIVGGTVIKIEKKTIQCCDYIFPSLAYNENLPFNICNIKFSSNMETHNIVSEITVKNYVQSKWVIALIANVEVEDIFGNKSVIKDVGFICDENNVERMKSTNGFIGKVQMNFIKKVYVIVKKFIMEDEKVYQVDEQYYIRNTEMSNEKLKQIRSIWGEDIVCQSTVDENYWTCYCGANNHAEAVMCGRCGRKISENKKLNDVMEQRKIEEILLELNTMNRTEEMVSYLNELAMPYFDDLLSELQLILKRERIYGDLSDSAKKKIMGMLTK